MARPEYDYEPHLPEVPVFSCAGLSEAYILEARSQAMKAREQQYSDLLERICSSHDWEHIKSDPRLRRIVHHIDDRMNWLENAGASARVAVTAYDDDNAYAQMREAASDRAWHHGRVL